MAYQEAASLIAADVASVKHADVHVLSEGSPLAPATPLPAPLASGGVEGDPDDFIPDRVYTCQRCSTPTPTGECCPACVANGDKVGEENLARMEQLAVAGGLLPPVNRVPGDESDVTLNAAKEFGEDDKADVSAADVNRVGLELAGNGKAKSRKRR